jgi:hypothetical protein
MKLSRYARPESPPVPGGDRTGPAVTSTDEYWSVEVRTESWRSWSTDHTGPHILYKSQDAAMDWAVKLRMLYKDVRVEHTVNEYLEVPVPSA